MASNSPRCRYQLCLRSETSVIYDKGKDTEHAKATNNNIVSPQTNMNSFMVWYKKLMDDDRNSLGLYIGDEAVLKWFGRTIINRKDIIGFLKCELNGVNHNISSVKNCEPIVMDHIKSTRNRNRLRFDDDTESLATPLAGDTPTKIINSLSQVSLSSLSCKRTRSGSSSPDLSNLNHLKKLRFNEDSPPSRDIKGKRPSPVLKYNLRPNTIKTNETLMTDLDYSSSTSAGNSPVKDKCPDLNKLVRHYIEAKCVLEFTKIRNKRGANIYKWERQCKLQVGYSEDPVCPGDYIVWTVVYSDNSSCRRNLMAAFDAA